MSVIPTIKGQKRNCSMINFMINSLYNKCADEIGLYFYSLNEYLSMEHNIIRYQIENLSVC